MIKCQNCAALRERIVALEAERDALREVVSDACDWVGVLDATADVANHALRLQWLPRARAALRGKRMNRAIHAPDRNFAGS